MKIVNSEVEPWECESFGDLAGDHDVAFEDDMLTADLAEKDKGAEIVSTFIYSRLDRSLLEKLPNLKLIATRSTGFDHIDTDYCREHGMRVANVPTYGENTVAEHVFALLLAISRSLADHVPLRLSNVVITPHSAFNTREAVQRILDTTRDTIMAFVTGQERNVVAA